MNWPDGLGSLHFAGRSVESEVEGCEWCLGAARVCLICEIQEDECDCSVDEPYVWSWLVENRLDTDVDAYTDEEYQKHAEDEFKTRFGDCTHCGGVA